MDALLTRTNLKEAEHLELRQRCLDDLVRVRKLQRQQDHLLTMIDSISQASADNPLPAELTQDGTIQEYRQRAIDALVDLDGPNRFRDLTTVASDLRKAVQRLDDVWALWHERRFQGHEERLARNLGHERDVLEITPIRLGNKEVALVGYEEKVNELKRWSVAAMKYLGLPVPEEGEQEGEDILL